MAGTTTANSKKISHRDRADDAEVVGRIFVAHSLKEKSKSHFAKRNKAPTVLLPEQVKLGLMMLEFRDQLLVLLNGAWERGEVNWRPCGGRTAILKMTRFGSSIPTTGDAGGIEDEA